MRSHSSGIIIWTQFKIGDLTILLNCLALVDARKRANISSKNQIMSVYEALKLVKWKFWVMNMIAWRLKKI